MYVQEVLSGARCYDFNANTSLAFQAVKNLTAHPTYLRFGLFFFINLRLFLVKFGEKVVFLKGSVKFSTIGDFEDLMLF